MEEVPEQPRRPCGGPWDALWAAAKVKAGLVKSPCPVATEKDLASPTTKE